MKILVVCVPRSGTTSFLNSLSKSTNIPLICLPDDFKYETNHSLITNSIKFNNLILRVVPSQNLGISIEKFSKLFDLTLLISRKNEQEQLESYINLYYRKNILGHRVSNSSEYGDTKYDYFDIPKKYKDEFINSNLWNEVLHNRNELKKLASILDTDIIYYEDLFFSEHRKELLENYLSQLDIDIDKLLNELNKTEKLRIQTTKKII